MKKIVNEIKAGLLSPFGRSTAYVYLAQVGGGGLGFLLNLILMRKLSVSDYGLFSLYTSAAMLFAGIFHLGWIDTYSRYGSMLIQESNFESVRKFFLKKVFKTLLVIGTVVLLFSSYISRIVYLRPDFLDFFRIAILNGIVLALYSFLSVELQIRQNFRNYFIAQISLHSLRFLLIAVGVVCAYLSLRFVISVNVLTPLLLVFLYAIWTKVFSTRFIGLESSNHATLVGAKSFQQWILFSVICNNLIGNIDLSILAHYHPNETLANYGVAARLTLPLHMMMVALGTVMLPKLASTENYEKSLGQMKKLIRYLLPLGLVLFLVSFFIPSILTVLAGEKYAHSEELIRLFLFSVVIVFVTNPPGTLLIAWGHTKKLAILNGIQLVIDIVLDFLWVPKLGAIGAIQATLVVHSMGTVFIYTQLWRAYHGRLKPIEAIKTN